MKTAKELRDKFEKDLEELQKNCKHKETSDWMTHMWAPGHLSPYEVKVCNICDKIVETRMYCEACGNLFSYEGEYPLFNRLCPECKKKGSHYCVVHNIFYDNDTCPECDADFGDIK